MKKHEQLYVAHVSAAVNFNNTASYRPFRIGLGDDEIIAIQRLVVGFAPGGANFNFTWALLQKNLTREDGITVATAIVRDDDNDILARGRRKFVVAVAQEFEDIQFGFPMPMNVPRSPTMEFESSLNASLACHAALYYNIRRVGRDGVAKLFKQFYGRKQ